MYRFRILAAAAGVFVLLAGCEAFDKEARVKYENATKRWDAGDYQTAAAMYVRLARDHPFSPHADNALYWVGVTQFLYLNETEKALETLRVLLKKYPRRDMAAAAQLQIAEIYERGYNDYPLAIVEYGKASAYADKEVREKSLYRLADNLFRVGRADDAQETWVLQTREFPQGNLADIAFYRLGTTAFSRGMIDEAEEQYRRSLDVSRDPEIAIKAKFALAQCLEAKESLKEALAIYQELEPQYANKAAIQIKIKALETRILKKSY